MTIVIRGLGSVVDVALASEAGFDPWLDTRFLPQHVDPPINWVVTSLWSIVKRLELSEIRHYISLHYLAFNTCLTLLMLTLLPARSLRSSSDTHILSIPNVKLKSYGQHSFTYHGPTAWNSYHLHSDINRNLTAPSELWKLICFLSINELNTSLVFCYFHY